MAADGFALPLYFALKGKHGYHFKEKMSFMVDIRRAFAEVAKAYDIVVIPESRVPLLLELTAGLLNVVHLKKQSMAIIREKAFSAAKWSKLERESQLRAWAEMGDVFTIHSIKSNQRQHYVPHLFEPVALPAGARVLLVDDFIMSGNTIKAMTAAIGREPDHVFGVFYQPGYTRNRKL